MITPRQARHGRPLPSATISLVVCVAVATFRSTPAGGQFQPDDRADADRLARSATESLQVQERRLAGQQALNEFLVRDREYRVLLSQADLAIAEGRTSVALDALQSVLDAGHDVFLWPEQGGPPVSARTAAGRILSQLSADARACYERKHGDAARQLWGDYRRRPDPALLAELLHRFAWTRAGREALHTEALRAMDHGNMLVAAGWWRQLLSDPEFAANIVIEDRVRAQVAFEFDGTSVPAALPPDLSHQTLTLAGATRTAADWVQEFVSRGRRMSDTARAATSTDWTLPFGIADTRLRSTGSRPVAEPLWSASYLAPPAAGDGGIVRTGFAPDTLPEPALASVVNQWRSARQEQRAPLAAASFPIIVGGLVVARDYSHITARDVRTGAVAWRYACASSFQRVLSELGPDATQSPVPVATGRSGDRPAAMFAFDAAFAENSVLGMLTSDGRRVFFVDDLAAEPPHAAAANTAAGADRPAPVPRSATNRLLALQLGEQDPPAGGRPLWTVGGPLAGDSADALAGCFFLGPPVPDGDRLFILAESRHELHLLALDAATGRLLWRQPVSLVDIPLDGDPLRARLACCPAVAHGIVVCPTQLGTLVGVNAATGTLLWVYSHVEEAGPHHVGRWQHAANRRFGSAAFPDLPLVIDGRVVVLPHQSEFVHCLDLQTGAGLWPPQPRDGALFAAAGNTDTLLLVGARQCAARHLHDGRLLWKTRIDTPVGRGIVAGDQYLVPTAHGTVASIEMATGRVLGNLVPAASSVTTTALRPVVPPDDAYSLVNPRPDDTPLGNLCVYEDLLVTTSPLGVAVFPQVEETLRSLLARMPPDRAAPADLLRAAELQLQLGRTAPARQFLQQALRADPPADIRAPAESHLREVLYAELAGSDDPAAALAALADLTRDPRQRGRFLVHRLEFELHSGDTAAVLRTTREALQLAIDRPVPMTAGGEYLAHPLRRMSVELARSAAARLPDLGLHRRDAGPAAVDPACDTAQLDLCGALSNSGPLRLRAADGCLQSGRPQSAELLLLQAVADPEPETAVAAAVLLSTFWEDRGLQFEAVALLDRLSFHRGRKQLHDGATIDEHLARRLAGRKCWQVCRSPTVPGPAPVVAIEQVLCPEGCPASDRPCDCSLLNSLFIGNREFARTPGATFCVVDRGIQPVATVDPSPASAGAPSRAVRLAIIDRARLRQTAAIDLPPHAWRAGAVDRYDAGHLLPIVGADVYGIALLEGRVLWSVPAESFDLRDRPCIGPYGPEFCIVQAGGTLTALDPADGRMLWRRTDLDYDAGLVTDDETGVIGDDRAIVVFDADRITYHVFDTRSGEFLRTGTLPATPADLRKRRWNFGRRLLFTSSDKRETRLRLWDPLDDTCPVDVLARGRLLHHESCRDGLLTTLNGQRLTILDVDTNHVLWTHDLGIDDVEGVRGLTVFADHARYYVHLERDVSQGRYSHLNGDVRVPHVQVEGDLFGIDRVTGASWRRTLPRSNLLLLPQHRLPFLVGISRIRDTQQRQSSMLMVQVLDAATGDLLAQREDLVKTSIVHTAFDPAAGELNLAGIAGRIAVSLRPEGAQQHSPVQRPAGATPTTLPPP